MAAVCASRGRWGACYTATVMALWTLHQDVLNAAARKYPGAEPGKTRADRPRTINVFANPFVEKYLSRAHWTTPAIAFAPIVTYGLYRGLTGGPGAWWRVPALLAAGALVWTLVEYLLHRFLFHTVTFSAERPVGYLLHEYHHDFPDDAERLVMPPTISYPIACIFGLAYWLTLGPVWMWPMLAGSAVGYVSYDTIHYFTHHGRPRGFAGRFLKRYHMVHHFRGLAACYGVSSPLWDFVFGTYKPSDTRGQEH